MSGMAVRIWAFELVDVVHDACARRSFALASYPSRKQNNTLIDHGPPKDEYVPQPSPDPQGPSVGLLQLLFQHGHAVPRLQSIILGPMRTQFTRQSELLYCCSHTRLNP